MTASWLEAGLIFFAAILSMAALSLWLRNKGFSKALHSGLTLKVISGLRLGTRERVIVLEVDQHWLVVGISPGGMHLLKELPKQDSSTQASPALPQGFATWLKEMLQRS